jgi:hypothetical protein
MQLYKPEPFETESLIQTQQLLVEPQSRRALLCLSGLPPLEDANCISGFGDMEHQVVAAQTVPCTVTGRESLKDEPSPLHCCIGVL